MTDAICQENYNNFLSFEPYCICHFEFLNFDFKIVIGDPKKLWYKVSKNCSYKAFGAYLFEKYKIY